MAHLPPVTWQEVATQGDLRVLGAELRTEMTQLSSELRGEMQELRTDMQHGFASVIKWVAGMMAAWSAVMITAIGVLF